MLKKSLQRRRRRRRKRRTSDGRRRRARRRKPRRGGRGGRLPPRSLGTGGRCAPEPRVVAGPRVGVGERLHRLLQLLELCLGLRVIRVLVWVSFEGEAVVGLLDLLKGGPGLHAQELVVRSARHRSTE